MTLTSASDDYQKGLEQMTALKNRKLLVVDDDPFFRLMLERLLNAEGASILTASGGNEALQILSRENVDLAISDVIMPDGSGIDFLNGLKDATKSPPPVVLVSGYSTIDSAKARELGAAALIPKPFKIGDLLEVVTSVLA